MAIFGLKGIMMDRVWAGQQRMTVLVNAATYYDGTGPGHLEKDVQVMLL